MSGRRSLIVAVATALTVGLIPVGLGAASDNPAAISGASERASVSAKPKTGRYQSKVDAGEEIALTTGKASIKRLKARIPAQCSFFDGKGNDVATEELGFVKAIPRGTTTGSSKRRVTNLTVRTSRKIAVADNGRFRALGWLHRPGVVWGVKGRFVNRNLVKGAVAVSRTRVVFDRSGSASEPFLFEICRGSERWSAKRKR